jgi:predicted nucleotidyltransferase
VAEAFLIGSAAVGGFDATTSDLDVVVVVERPLDDRAALVRGLRALQPPGRDLELVVYVAGSQPPEFELNFSGGDERPHEPYFWFVLDAAIAEQRSLALRHARSWSEFFEPIPEERIRAALKDSIAWSERQPVGDEFARLNAIRSRHRLEHGEWIAKQAARELRQPSARAARGEGSPPSG